MKTMRRGARPPRAQFSAPSRKTSSGPKRSAPKGKLRAPHGGTRGASRDARGGRAPPSSVFGMKIPNFKLQAPVSALHIPSWRR